MRLRIQQLATQMLPDLMSQRFNIGRGGWDDDEWVAYSVKLAEKIILESELGELRVIKERERRKKEKTS